MSRKAMGTGRKLGKEEGPSGCGKPEDKNDKRRKYRGASEGNEERREKRLPGSQRCRRWTREERG